MPKNYQQIRKKINTSIIIRKLFFHFKQIFVKIFLRLNFFLFVSRVMNFGYVSVARFHITQLIYGQLNNQLRRKKFGIKSLKIIRKFCNKSYVFRKNVDYYLFYKHFFTLCL